MDALGKIFVQVPSYRDPQLIPTLSDLIDNARNPQELKVVICWQHDTDETLDDFVVAGFRFDRSEQQYGNTVHILRRKGAVVELIDICFLQAKGCGWARHTAQNHYCGEQYNLQMRFTSSLLGRMGRRNDRYARVIKDRER